MNKNRVEASCAPLVDPLYSSGDYFRDPGRHAEDAQFKARCFLEVFLPLAREYQWQIRSYVDVGCGSGAVIRCVAHLLYDAGFNLGSIKGYDVAPHVDQLRIEGIEFVHGDFRQSDELVDLVTLFDVFEHVTDPIEFIKSIGSRSRILGFHIPLDNSLNHALRDKFRKLLRDPGHLLFMDSVYALNLLTLAGLKVIGYRYTFGFLAPSGHKSLLSKIVFPFRVLLGKISPWLLSKTVGGASLLVIALTPQGQQTNAKSII